MVSGKKRKASRVSLDPVSTKLVSHTWEKDDEELELESALFGTSKKRVGSGAGVNGHVTSEDVEMKRMEDMEDDDLFTIDAPVASYLDGGGNTDDDEDREEVSEDESEGQDRFANGETDEEEDDDEDDDESDASGPSIHMDDTTFKPVEAEVDADDDDEEGVSDVDVKITFPADLQSSSSSSSSSRSSSRSRSGSPSVKGKERRQALWVDPADEMISVDLIKDRRMRKMARGKAGEEGVVDGRELEKRLREQFERLHPRPQWASNRVKSGTPALRSLLSSTKSFVSPLANGSGSRPPLARGVIEMQRLLDANHQNPTTGKKEASNAGNGVVDIAWHPSSRVGVLAVGGGDRRVRFFNIDGHTNAALLTIHLPSLPLGRTTFHPSGTSLLLTGTRPYYYTYDLIASRCVRSPRNLFGSVQTSSSPNTLTRHAFSPGGTLLAVAGRRGAVSILDWSGSGVGAVVAELKSGRGGSVVDLVWTGQKELSVLGGRDGAEVEVWDVGSRSVVRKWRDERCYGGSIMRLSEDEKWTAVGSSTGIVNLYESSDLRGKSSHNDALQHLSPEPFKSLEHLTTPITSLAFHPSSELLVTASDSKRNRLKLYHLASGSAYGNWPTQTTPLGRINAMAFSSGGDYLATGNQRGKVLLYSLKHYANA
ncbi:WD40-repeat-containing domain protein [Kockovaella imperatae]|uniref:WD40-repeat-containing domain protein n=1 Tax=Kockovaella imperatae TaxID=4999 RepID=A0A1Y1UPX9_9TREE|nr:WD40-repeat-containing domain protein [Kockovaella imperatae]ORX39627.1 WD40-repeat-containing domain protein [Kockovaella imperatae]